MEKITREIYKDDFTEYLLCLALDVGEGMLKNGGEVGRVEDTIERICRAYGAQHVEVFTIVSMINAAIRMPDGSYSLQLRRVKQTGNNLGMLEKLNALSREICATTPSLEVFEEKLRSIKKIPVYPVSLHILASALGAGAFCMFFGGGVIDSIITFFIGIIICLINNYRSKRINSMAKTVICSFIATTASVVFSMMISSVGVDYIIIGAIMLLVPGLLFATAVRDLFCGDLIAGTLKILQAFLQILMIGFGYMLSYAMLGDLLINATIDSSAGGIVVQLITAALTSVAFAVVFKTDKRHLVSVAICGTLTFAAYYFILLLTDSLFWASFLSSVFAAFYSEVNARVRKAPAIVVLMPAVISIVPGGYFYRSVRDLIKGSIFTSLAEFGAAGEIALGLAGGIVVASIIFGVVYDGVKGFKKQNNVNKSAQDKEL